MCLHAISAPSWRNSPTFRTDAPAGVHFRKKVSGTRVEQSRSSTPRFSPPRRAQRTWELLSRAMSFAASVAALRTLFGVPDDAPLLEAIQVMNISMGIVGEGPLPKQVQALVDATGVNLRPPLEG